MKIRATVASGVELNDLVTHDVESNQWVKANSHLGLLGSIIGIDSESSTAIIEFNAGVVAYTSRVLAPYGGRLNVEGGRVYIDNTNGSLHRFIYPQSENLDSDGNIGSGTLVRVVI